MSFHLLERGGNRFGLIRADREIRWVENRAIAPRLGSSLSVRREGAVEWLTLGGVPIGRLRRFGTDDAPAATTDFGFELHLPAHVDDDLALDAARAIDRALELRGIALPASHVRRHAPATRRADPSGLGLSTDDHRPPAA